jgi:hypothetical protein
LKRDQKGRDDEDPDKNPNQEDKEGSTGKEGKSDQDDSGETKPNGSGGKDNDTKKSTGGSFGPFRWQTNHYSKKNTRNDSDGGSGGSGLPPNFSSTMLTAILLLGLTYIMMRNDDESGTTPSDFSTREITWNDFCKYLLETGQVEKIVVTNNRAVAKVFLKPGSQGLPQYQSRHFRYSDRRQQAATVTDPIFEDSTHIGDGSSGEGLGSSLSSLPHAKGHGHQHQIVYRFAM